MGLTAMLRRVTVATWLHSIDAEVRAFPKHFSVIRWSLLEFSCRKIISTRFYDTKRMRLAHVRETQQNSFRCYLSRKMLQGKLGHLSAVSGNVSHMAMCGIQRYWWQNSLNLLVLSTTLPSNPRILETMSGKHNHTEIWITSKDMTNRNSNSDVVYCSMRSLSSSIKHGWRGHFTAEDAARAVCMTLQRTAHYSCWIFLGYT